VIASFEALNSSKSEKNVTPSLRVNLQVAMQQPATTTLFRLGNQMHQHRSTSARGITTAMLLLAGCGYFGSALALEPMPGAPTQQTISATTDQLIVKYRVSSAATTLSADSLGSIQVLGNRAGVSVSHHRSRVDGSHVLKMNRFVSLAQARTLAEQIQSSDANVEYAEPDVYAQAMLVPNDSRYAQQWGYFDSVGGINGPAAWDKASGAGVVVAVLDTGYRPHTDLVGNLVKNADGITVAGYDFLSSTTNSNDGDGRDSNPIDPGDFGTCSTTSSWHGTHVAGTIAAVTNNSTGVAGVARSARILPVRVLGNCGGPFSDISDAIIWASGGTVSGVPANTNPAKVINMSLGGTSACPTTLQNAINSARSRGTVVVVAAGNSNTDASTSAPANCTGVIAVAATSRTGSRSYYSNYGSIVDVAAPGGDFYVDSGILSTLNSGVTTPGADSYASYQGTSMATPHVAGVAALMMSVNTTLTPDQVEAKIKSTARAFPGTCSLCGTGIVDASAAVTASLPSVTTVVEVESNNTIATAQSITSNPVLIKGTISSTADTDYYKVTIGAGKTLVATLTPNNTANFDLYGYNSAGSNTTKSANGTGLADTVSVLNKTTTVATYYIRVVRLVGTGTYTLSLTQ
jgi:serine protease